MTTTTLKRNEKNIFDNIKAVNKLDEVKEINLQESSVGKALKDYDLIMNVDVSPEYHFALFDFISSDRHFHNDSKDFKKWAFGREVPDNEFVIPDGKFEKLINSYTPILTPGEIKEFTKIVVTGCKNLKNFSNTGVYISSLVDESYRSGMNNFEFENNDLDYLCSFLLGNSRNPIRIRVGENNGLGLGYCSDELLLDIDKNFGDELAYGGHGMFNIRINYGDNAFEDLDSWSTISIKENYGDKMRLNTEIARVFIEENEGTFLAEQLKNSEIYIGKESRHLTGISAVDCKFISHNKRTLDRLMATPKKGNKFYLIENGVKREYTPKKHE